LCYFYVIDIENYIKIHFEYLKNIFHVLFTIKKHFHVKNLERVQFNIKST